MIPFPISNSGKEISRPDPVRLTVPTRALVDFAFPVSERCNEFAFFTSRIRVGE